MSVLSPVDTRLYSVLLAGDVDGPGTWVTVTARDLVEAMRVARENPWWGECVPEWAQQAHVVAIECLGVAWH